MQKDLFDKIVAALLPEMGNAEARKSLVESALFGSVVLQKIDWSGAAGTFTTRLVRQLDEFGEISPGKKALAALLEDVKLGVGADRQAQIDDLLAQLQGATAKPSAPRPQAVAPPPRPDIQPPAKAFDGELYIFLSYARPDQAVAEQVEKFLESAGILVFRDTSDIGAGDNWDLKIEAALRDCQAMVLLLSTSSMPDRKEVHREWFHFDQQGKPIYPLCIEECRLHSRFESRNYIDARTDLEGALKRLLNDLRRNFPLPVQVPAPAAEPPSSPGPPPTRGLETGEISPIQRKRRRIDAAVPSSMEVGQSIDLVIQVRFPDSPTLGIEDWPLKRKPASLEQSGEITELAFPVNLATGEVGSSRLKVRVIAPDFSIQGAAEKILDVPPTEYSRKLSFLLSAKKPGNCRINVEIYGATPDCLGTIPIETAVGGTAAAPTVNIANFFFVVTTNPILAQASGDRQVNVGGSAGGSVIVTGDGNEIIINKRGEGKGMGKDNTGTLTAPPNPPAAGVQPDPAITVAKTTSSRALVGVIATAVITAFATISGAVFANWDKIMAHPSPASKSGRVVNKFDVNVPVGGAHVSLKWKGVSKDDRADTDGYFPFPIIDPTKEIRLRIEAEDFEPLDMRVTLEESPSTQVFYLTPKYQYISGQVVDEYGKGIEGVDVIVLETNEQVKTDGKGAYRIPLPTRMSDPEFSFSKNGYDRVSSKKSTLAKNNNDVTLKKSMVVR